MEINLGMTLEEAEELLRNILLYGSDTNILDDFQNMLFHEIEQAKHARQVDAAGHLKEGIRETEGRG